MMSAGDQAAPERIWLDLPSFNLAVAFAHPKGHRKDGWTEYIRADLAAPSAPVKVEGLVRRLLAPTLLFRREFGEEAATALIAQEAKIAALQDENERLTNRAEVAEYKRRIAVEHVQPMLIVCAEKAEAERDALDRRWTTAVQLAAHAHNTEGDPGVLIDAANARAERAEAVADRLAEVVLRLKQEAEIDGKASEAGWDCWIIMADEARSAHAKLKGEV